MPTFFVLVGDGTTANGTTPNSGGWGNGFCGSEITGSAASLVAGTPCINTAKNGATTGTFWNVSLAAIRGVIPKGRRTLVTIQFRHNDMKIAPPKSMGINLTEMVNQVRGLGAEPVPVTSLTGGNFNTDRTVAETLGPWADQTTLISRQRKTHLLDLHPTSVKYVEAIGPDTVHRLNRLLDDNTRLNVNGTTVFGRYEAVISVFDERSFLMFRAKDVADLINMSFPGELPVVPNQTLSFEIWNGIPSF